eukprot:scaffold10755_cov126-Skeletonema_marinoi.AAC.2
MANTEGLTDEVVSSMLAMPSPDEERQLHSRKHAADNHPRFPQRALARREEMMESLGEGEMPAARVIRASRAPKIHSSAALKNKTQNIDIKEQSITPTPPAEIMERTQQKGDSDRPTDSVANKNSHRPVIISDSIRERPAEPNNNKSTSATAQPKKRESRFKQRQLKKGGSTNPTVGGFPSLDFAPVGSLTRKGRMAQGQDSSSTVTSQMSSAQSTTQYSTKINQSTSPQRANDIGNVNESMLANMSIDEIRDGVEEVKSILSAESIAFLRNRAKQKRNDQVTQQKDVPAREKITAQNNDVGGPSLTKEIELELEEKKVRKGKEKVAELLSKIRTPEDMDLAYNEAIELGLAPSLPTSSLESTNDKNSTDERNCTLHTATSLLRSTSFRQRLLGARSVCNILEEDVKAMLIERQRSCFSISTDDRMSLQKSYPPLLPVAIRCILDESLALAHTSSGMALLSQGLRSIHCLMKLFVHPYHVVNVNPSSIGLYDPFELYATSFMSDISHVPSGAELYPPTTITPIEKSGTNGSCYRADSSAASAESDAKVFYNDPPWILLSRMRILPCLSDVIAFLSKDVSSGGRIQVATLQSICGILAMLAVRLPGAALAIANHKGLLPFLASYCLSPRPDESGALFDTQNVLPFLILLCTLARQSKDVAGLDMPFDSIMPHLQGILCLQTDNENELEVQIWSLVLLRILVRYGLAIEHVQSLISIAAPHVAVQKPQNTICVHFLSFFADICDASNVIQSQSGSQLSSIPEQDNSLPMSAVWLSSSVKSCTTSLPALLRDCSSDDRDSVLKMASSQLRFLSSFATAAKQSTTTASVPILSKESCRSVIEGILESDLLKHALETSLGWSYRASWLEVDDESRAIALENEAIACAFVISFMDLAANFATDNVIAPKLLVAVLSVLNNVKSQNGELAHTNGNNVHVARQSWFVEAEYSVLKYLSDIGAGENGRSLILAFAVTLVGRMNVGHEALAYFVFGQQDLFRVNGCTDLFRSLFLGELSVASRDRKEQLEHSAKLFNKGPLNSLRCTADFSTAANARQERFFLPVGTTWIWNVLSSTITSGEAYGEDQGIKNATGIVAGALSLLMQLEVSCPLQVNTGTKLYHLCNVCLFPEEILRDDTIAASLSLLFSQLCGVPSKESNDFVVVRDFIQECFQHSRLSRAKKATDDEATDTDPSLATEKLLLDDEMRALDDFVGDLCESFIEYGGQYVFCARFMRFFFRHDFPTKITKSVAEKLLPILNLLSVEDETRDSLQLSLLQSMKGGLPSMDSSSRDSSALLDIFAAALKKVNKLNRQDYFYMLSISFLSRNMASSFQRCECGLEAMKKRLSGVTSAIFYDVVLTSKQLLCDKSGTKESMVGRVIERCLDYSANFQMQDKETQKLWQWTPSNESATWKMALDLLDCVKDD